MHEKKIHPMQTDGKIDQKKSFSPGENFWLYIASIPIPHSPFPASTVSLTLTLFSCSCTCFIYFCCSMPPSVEIQSQLARGTRSHDQSRFSSMSVSTTRQMRVTRSSASSNPWREVRWTPLSLSLSLSVSFFLNTA